MDLVRLACVRHAASVRPEPGSNSPSRSRAAHRSERPFDRFEEPAIPRAEALVLCRLAPEQPAKLLSVSSAFILMNGYSGASVEAPVQSPALAFSSSLLRSEEHTSELQSLMRISYAVFCLKKKNKTKL